MITFEEKSSLASEITISGIPAKNAILFIRNLNADDGRFEDEMPVNRYLEKAQVAL